MRKYRFTAIIYDDNLGLNTCKVNSKSNLLQYHFNEGTITFDDIEIESVEEVIEKLDRPEKAIEYLKHRANNVGEVNSLEVLEYVSRLEQRIKDLE